MSDRTGWFGAAALAAVLAAGAAGCGGGPKPKDDGGTPPSETGTAEPGGQPTDGTATGEPGTQPPASTDGTTPGGQPADGTQPPADGTAGGGTATPPGGGDTTQPAGAGGATAMEPGLILVEVGFDDARQAQASVRGGGAGTAQTVAVKEGDVPQELVTMLKEKRDQMTSAGQRAHVVVSGPLDVPFETVVIPVMKAAFRAGFQRADVEYKPPAK